MTLPAFRLPLFAIRRLGGGGLANLMLWTGSPS